MTNKLNAISGIINKAILLQTNRKCVHKYGYLTNNIITFLWTKNVLFHFNNAMLGLQTDISWHAYIYFPAYQQLFPGIPTAISQHTYSYFPHIHSYSRHTYSISISYIPARLYLFLPLFDVLFTFEVVRYL